MLEWWLDQCHVVCHYSFLHLQSSLVSSFNINNSRSSSSFSITDGFANLRKLAIVLNIKDFATSGVLENCIKYFLACIDHIHQIIYEHQQLLYQWHLKIIITMASKLWQCSTMHRKGTETYEHFGYKITFNRITFCRCLLWMT